jgi:hypothetical protein
MQPFVHTLIRGNIPRWPADLRMISAQEKLYSEITDAMWRETRG